MRSSSPSASSTSHNNKKPSNSNSNNNNPVSVYCRFAPVLDSSREQIHVAIDGVAPNCTVTAADTVMCSWVQIGCNDVIDPSWSQEEVFNSVALPTIQQALLLVGENSEGQEGAASQLALDSDQEQLRRYYGNQQNQATTTSSKHFAVLSYAPTGTGKTHTILAPNGATNFSQVDPIDFGLVPRTLQYLFSSQNNQNQQKHMSVEITCVEIHNEAARDLVAVLRGPEFAAASTYKATEKMRVLKSLQRARCESLNASFELLKRILALRRTSSTASNDTSSRSHLVIRIILPLHNSNSLTFGDLAGSESLKYTSASQMALMLMNNNNNNNKNNSSSDEAATRNENQAFQLKQETKNINVSLLALKKVVRALRTNSDHIPFKDSMLTTILEPCFTTAVLSFSASSRTVASPLQIIVCCSGYQRDSSETLATLRFASEASAIKPLGTLNPLTMSVLQKREHEQQLAQKEEQMKKRQRLHQQQQISGMKNNNKIITTGGRSQQNEASNSRSSSCNTSMSTSSTTSSSALVNDNANEYYQQQQQQQQQQNRNDEDDKQVEIRRGESIASVSTRSRISESRSDSHCSNNNINNNNQSSSTTQGESMQRVLTALVDENANLRMQVASQKQELEESSAKARILMEKSTELLERYENLHRECARLREENSKLKNNNNSNSNSTNYRYSQNEDEDDEENDDDYQASSTPPPTHVKLQTVRIASPSSSSIPLSKVQNKNVMNSRMHQQHRRPLQQQLENSHEPHQHEVKHNKNHVTFSV